MLNKDLSLFFTSLEDSLVLTNKTVSKEVWYTTGDVMRLFKLSRSTIYRLRRLGALPYCKLGGTYVYPKHLINTLFLVKAKQSL